MTTRVFCCCCNFVLLQKHCISCSRFTRPLACLVVCSVQFECMYIFFVSSFWWCCCLFVLFGFFCPFANSNFTPFVTEFSATTVPRFTQFFILSLHFFLLWDRRNCDFVLFVLFCLLFPFLFLLLLLLFMLFLSLLCFGWSLATCVAP